MLLTSLLSPSSGSGGSSNIVTVREVTTAGAITVSATTDYVILVNKSVAAATTVNLPAGQSGLTYVIKDKKGDANSNNITVVPNGSETINGGANYVMNVNNQAIWIIFNNGTWSLI